MRVGIYDEKAAKAAKGTTLSLKMSSWRTGVDMFVCNADGSEVLRGLVVNVSETGIYAYKNVTADAGLSLDCPGTYGARTKIN